MELKDIYPPFLVDSIEYWNSVKDDKMQWDLGYEDLRSSINIAEVEGMISSAEAWELRRTLLGMGPNGGIKGLSRWELSPEQQAVMRKEFDKQDVR